MKAINKEMKEFIETISKQEKCKNPKLQKKINALLESLNGLNQKLNKSPQEITSNPHGVLQYLDEKMLN